MLLILLFVTKTTSWGNGDNDGDGCNRGLAGIDGDGLGVKNGPEGDRIPKNNKTNDFMLFTWISSSALGYYLEMSSTLIITR